MSRKPHLDAEAVAREVERGHGDVLLEALADLEDAVIVDARVANVLQGRTWGSCSHKVGFEQSMHVKARRTRDSMAWLVERI
jgi:hypothetical protein